TNSGTTWTAITGVADTTALLLTANASTRVRLISTANWNGPVAGGLTFRAWDQTTGTAGTQVDTTTNGTTTAFSTTAAQADIVVNAVNDAPSFTKGGDQTALEDEITKVVDGWATAISAGQADEAGQALTFEVSTNNDALFSALPAIDATGRLTFTPAADATGTATITVRLRDNGGTDLGGVDVSAAQTFTITITPVNDVPSFTKGADQLPVTGSTAHVVQGWATDILPGSSDDESTQTLTFTITTDNDAMFAVPPQINPETGDLTYTLANNATGSATVSVVLKDSGGTANGGADTSDTQTFTITVSENTPPTAGDDAYETNEDVPLVVDAETGLLANDADVNGTDLTIAVETQPAHGTLALNTDGSFTYTPEANWNGVDTFTYHVNDGLASSGTATVTITVNLLNDVPSFTKGANQYAVKNAGAKTITGWATAISTGAANEATQNLSFEITTNNNSLFAVLPAIDPATGTLTYTPATDAFGVATVTVRLKDDGGTALGGVDTSAAQTFTITINGLPVANNDTYTAVQNSSLTVAARRGVMANDTDDENSTLTASIIGRTRLGWLTLAHGSVKLAADGSFTYVPVAGFVGTETFTYRISDGVAKSNTATVTITVVPPNHAPTARGLAKATKPGGSAVFNVLPRASDVDNDPLIIRGVATPKYGTATINDHGTPDDRTDDYIVYQPSAGSYADDSFKYTISDGRGGTAVAWANVRVQGAALIPSADSQTTDLVVVGYSGNDTIKLSPVRTGTRVVCNGTILGAFNPTGRIIVDSRAGNDTIDTSALTRGVVLYGGDGNDILIGTSYSDVFSGGNGSDLFRSRGGRDTYVDRTASDSVLSR
ncbi:MAG: Ig-like domain-containing protein, partial [Bacillota bacterium]